MTYQVLELPEELRRWSSVSKRERSIIVGRKYGSLHVRVSSTKHSADEIKKNFNAVKDACSPIDA